MQNPKKIPTQLLLLPFRPRFFKSDLQDSSHTQNPIPKITDHTFSIKDDSSARSSKRFMRRRRHDVRVFEWRRCHFSRYQSGNMGHIRHQIGPVGVAYFSESLVIQIPRIAADAGDNELRFEQRGVASQFFVIQIAGGRIDFVRHRLEEDGGGGYFLFVGVIPKKSKNRVSEKIDSCKVNNI